MMYFQENGNKTVKSHVEKIDSKCQIIHTTISNKRKRTTIEKHDVEDDVKHNDEDDTDGEDEGDSDDEDSDGDNTDIEYEGDFETAEV